MSPTGDAILPNVDFLGSQEIFKTPFKKLLQQISGKLLSKLTVHEEVSLQLLGKGALNFPHMFQKVFQKVVINGLEEILPDPTLILNGDKTSFSICPETGKVIAFRGWKDVCQISNGNEEEAITVLLVISAAGGLLLLVGVFLYVIPSSGWMRIETFYKYLANENY